MKKALITGINGQDGSYLVKRPTPLTRSCEVNYRANRIPQGEIKLDESKPDGQPRRMLNTSKAKEKFDFLAKTDFREGLKKTIQWYEENALGE